MNPFDMLGIPPDSDIATIKRAYARLLKMTRPDTDPAGFQRLHDAYQRALQWRQRPVSAMTTIMANVDDATTVAMAPVTAAPNAAAPIAVAITTPPAVVFGFEAFYQQLLMLFADGDEEALLRALHAHPALWWLEEKTIAGRRLLAQLLRDRPAMPRYCLDIILDFFDLDQVRGQVDPIALERMARRAHLAWELQPEHRDALARRLDMTSPGERRRLDAHIKRLSRPFSWWRGITAGFVPYRGRHMAAFIRTLSMGHPDDLPASIPRDQLRFWIGTNIQSPMNINQALFFGGLLLMISVIAGIGGLAYQLSSGARSGGNVVFIELGVLWGCALLVAAGVAGMRGWQRLEHWQCAREGTPTSWPRLRLATLPMLWLAGLLVAAIVPWKAFGVVWILPALWLSLRRYWRRHDGTGLYVKPGMAQIGLIAAAALLPVPPLYVFAVAAALAWIEDWRRNVLAAVY